jgi:hypothetical protein
MMYNTYFTINTIIELICFLIAFTCLFSERNSYWKIFGVYMFITFIIETVGLLLRNQRIPNQSLYTGFLAIECFMISLFFYQIFKNYNHKATLLYGWLIIFLSVFFSELSTTHFKRFPYISAAFMSVVFVVASLYFYYLILKDEKFRKLTTDSEFWIVNGILFYYFGSTACNIFFDYLLLDSVAYANLPLRYIIFVILNIFLYGCWSYAFICRFLQRE